MLSSLLILVHLVHPKDSSFEVNLSSQVLGRGNRDIKYIMVWYIGMHSVFFMYLVHFNVTLIRTLQSSSIWTEGKELQKGERCGYLLPVRTSHIQDNVQVSWLQGWYPSTIPYLHWNHWNWTFSTSIIFIPRRNLGIWQLIRQVCPMAISSLCEQ